MHCIEFLEKFFDQNKLQPKLSISIFPFLGISVWKEIFLFWIKLFLSFSLCLHFTFSFFPFLNLIIYAIIFISSATRLFEFLGGKCSRIMFCSRSALKIETAMYFRRRHFVEGIQMYFVLFYALSCLFFHKLPLFAYFWYWAISPEHTNCFGWYSKPILRT